MNPTFDADEDRRLADIDTEKVDKLPAGKRETRFVRKPGTTNQPRTADWRDRLSTTTEIAAPRAAFGYFRFSPISTRWRMASALARARPSTAKLFC